MSFMARQFCRKRCAAARLRFMSSVEMPGVSLKHERMSSRPAAISRLSSAEGSTARCSSRVRPRPFQSPGDGHFNGVGDTMSDKKRAGRLVVVVVDNEQKMEVVWHYHIVANRHRRPDAMHCP